MNELYLNMPAMAQARIAASLDACEGLTTSELEALGAGALEQLRNVLQRLAEKVARASAITLSANVIDNDDWRELELLQREAFAVLAHPRTTLPEGGLFS